MQVKLNASETQKISFVPTFGHTLDNKSGNNKEVPKTLAELDQWFQQTPVTEDPFDPDDLTRVLSMTTQKKALERKFQEAPLEVTPVDLLAFNQLRGVPNYKGLVLGQLAPRQNPFHQFILEKWDKGPVMQHLAKLRKRLPNGFAFLGPVSLQTPQEAIKKGIESEPHKSVVINELQTLSPSAQKKTFGLSDADTGIIYQSPRNWMENIFPKFDPNKQKSIIQIAQERLLATRLRVDQERLDKIRIDNPFIKSNETEILAIKTAAGFMPVNPDLYFKLTPDQLAQETLDTLNKQQERHQQALEKRWTVFEQIKKHPE